MRVVVDLPLSRCPGAIVDLGTYVLVDGKVRGACTVGEFLGWKLDAGCKATAGFGATAGCGATAGRATGALVTWPTELEACGAGAPKPTPPPRSPAFRDCVSKSAPAIKNNRIVFIPKAAPVPSGRHCAIEGFPPPPFEIELVFALVTCESKRGARGQIFFDASD